MVLCTLYWIFAWYLILKRKGIFVWVCTDMLPFEIFDQISHLKCTNAVGNHMRFMTTKLGSK